MMLVTNILVLIQTITKFQYSIEKDMEKISKMKKSLIANEIVKRVNSELN